MSCEKEITNDLSNTSDALSDIRTELDSTNLIWLEEFRLNLLSTEGQFYYTIPEVEYGIETIYNLIGSVGPMEYTNPRIYKDSILIPLTDGVINGSNVKNLSSKVFSLVEDYVFKEDQGFLFVDLNIEQLGSDAMARISVNAAEVSEPDLSSAYLPFCEQSFFSSSECYRSAIGNERIGWPLFNGGICGNPNNETSAQLEVEKVILQNIPRFVYSNRHNPNFNVLEGIYKYINPTEHSITLGYDIFETIQNTYFNCQDIGLWFFDNVNIADEIEYNSVKLNCTLCLLYDYIESVKPQDKELCDIIVWGEPVWNEWDDSTVIVWQAKISFCDVKIIPPYVTWNEPQSIATNIPTEDDFLVVISFTDL